MNKRKCGCVYSTTSDANVRKGYSQSGECVEECDEHKKQRLASSEIASSYPKLKWWAYLHTNGQVLVKRYWDMLDLTEAIDSPFVQKVYGPFEAGSSHEAVEVARLQLLPSRRDEKGD